MHYVTWYPGLKGNTYSSFISEAADPEAVIRARGLNERIIGTSEDCQPTIVASLPDLIHHLVFMLLLAPPELHRQFLDDDAGILHLAVHVLTDIFPWSKVESDLIEGYARLSAQVPGFIPAQIEWGTIAKTLEQK